MIWEDTRWESKVKEKWGKADADDAIAGNIRDFRFQAAVERELDNARDRDPRRDDRAA